MRNNFKSFLIVAICCFACKQKENSPEHQVVIAEIDGITIEILGIAQDAGYPQIQCKKSCCIDVWKDPSKRKMVSSIGLTNQSTHQSWLFDATPDIKFQVNNLLKGKNELAGVFLTHAHMGHYTGLMHLGREAMGAKNVPVYAMPRLSEFLQTNGPWSQLVTLKNIQLIELKNKVDVQINKGLSVTPIEVPHRDEFSETVGFKISGPDKDALFIPDIDKWGKWSENILEQIKTIDYAFLDGTFFANGEIPGRDMSEIPHPFIEESMTLFNSLPAEEKAKIYFIHFNHTNPVLKKDSDAYKSVIDAGFNICHEGDVFKI